MLGIVGLVFCGGILGPVAWILGNSALKEIDANPMAYTNRSNVQAGRILGMVSTAMLVLGIVVYALFFLVIALGTMSAN